jgi:UDP-glucose 4-epimerase
MGTLKAEEVKTILIIGIAGGLAQILSEQLHTEFPHAKIVGVDSRPLESTHIPNVTIETFRYSRGNFEKLFREYNFDLVYHLGRVSHANLGNQLSLAKRLDLNIIGTSRILDLCLKHEIKKIIILSTFHVYGALPDNPAFVNEESFLRASIAYPALRDVVQMDQLTTSWMWKNQNQMKTIILRPCNIIGSQIKNAISRYLLNPWTPTPIDYNPMFQFIHESDMARVLQKCVELVPTGIYNVSPHEFISLKEARDSIGIPGVPFSLFMLGRLAGVYKRFNPELPDYLLDYLKFSCLIDSHELSRYLGKDFCRFTIKDTLELLKLNERQ